MYKQSPSRNQRSKGIKVKHVLQVCLLLAVCFWLIYQVKHSHDKKKEFDEHDAKSSLDSVRKDEVVKLGRKDLHPLKEGTVVASDKHDEEVEDEETEEETPVEEENNKHEDEGKENKTEEKDENDEGRGDVEEEVDDHDQEKSDVENDRDEDFVDEEKERDDDEEELKDKESDDKNEQTDTGSDSQEHDNEGGTMRRHEAREENYKADDASSAVTSDNQITSNGNETVVLGKSSEQGEDGDEGHLDTTTNENSKTIISNSSVTGVSTTHGNSTEKSGEVQDVSLLNGNGTVSEHNEEQSVAEEHEKSSVSSKLDIGDPKLESNSTFLVNGDLQGFNSTFSSESKSTDPNPVESHTHAVTKSSNPEMKDNVTSKKEGNSTMTENSSVVENSEDDESKAKSSYDMELDTENSSDSKLSLEETDVGTDLETLPNIKTEGDNSEDDTAE